MASSSIPARTLLLVAYGADDVLGSDDDKLRTTRVAAVAIVDGERLVREHGSGADLRGADLYGADLRGAYLSDANLRGADLRGANLYGADLRGADLYCADLRGADLYCADLRGANLYGANLRGAVDLTDSLGWDKVYAESRILPDEGDIIGF